jgi:hypothetical protein
MTRRVIQAVLIVLLVGAGLSPNIVWGHGAVSLEDDICMRRMGGNMVHFSAYQPQFEPKAQYCTEIPGVGDTFLVVDLVDPSLRTVPVSVRIIKGAGEDERQEDQTVAYWKPSSHPDGVVRGEANLEKGLYKVIVTAEGLSPSYYLLRVQQVDYSKVGRKAVGPIMVVLVLALIWYEMSKSGRLKNWWPFRKT